MVSDSCAVVAVGGQRRLCLFRVSRAAVSVFCILAFDFFLFSNASRIVSFCIFMTVQFYTPLGRNLPKDTVV